MAGTVIPVAERIRRLTAESHGVLDVGVARRAGLAEATIRSWASRGYLTRVSYGVYMVPPDGGSVPWLRLVMARYLWPRTSYRVLAGMAAVDIYTFPEDYLRSRNRWPDDDEVIVGVESCYRNHRIPWALRLADVDRWGPLPQRLGIKLATPDVVLATVAWSCARRRRGKRRLELAIKALRLSGLIDDADVQRAHGAYAEARRRGGPR